MYFSMANSYDLPQKSLSARPQQIN